MDTTTGRDLVRIWKCTDVEGCTSYSYDTGTCPEGVYYDWQEIDVVNIWIKKVWKTTTSWQMITRNDTEKQLLISQDTDIPEAGISDIGTLMEQAISSSASESQEVNNKVQEIMSTVRDTFPRNVDNWERARSRSPRGSTAQLCDETTLQTPILCVCLNAPFALSTSAEHSSTWSKDERLCQCFVLNLSYVPTTMHDVFFVSFFVSFSPFHRSFSVSAQTNIRTSFPYHVYYR